MTTRNQANKIAHTAWLLASLAPSNLAKGRAMLDHAPDDERIAAEHQARTLVALYISEGSDAAGAAYADHPYHW